MKNIEWIAGLFEGEGCINIRTQRGAKSSVVTLRLGSTDEDVITALHERSGVGTKTFQHSPSHQARGNKPMHIWTVKSRPEVAEILEAMIPHLFSRRKAKAIEALELTRSVMESRVKGPAYKI